MSTSVVPRAVPPEMQTQILDEGRWQAWQQKGRARDARSAVLRLRALQWGAILTLLAAAFTAPEAQAYAMAVRVIVSVAAVALMLQAARVGQYALAAALSVVALLHNPGVPAFGFSSGSDRMLALVSTAPFFVMNGSRWKSKGDFSPEGKASR